MVVENKYLRRALAKAGYVVLVKNYNLNEKTCKLSYISPNASELGMNVEMLNKGMKLTEDYIFPEDRGKVISNVRNAIDSKVHDYVHTYRMVGDDAVLYNVSSEIVLEWEAEGIATIECYIRKVDLEEQEKSASVFTAASASPTLNYQNDFSVQKYGYYNQDATSTPYQSAGAGMSASFADVNNRYAEADKYFMGDESRKLSGMMKGFAELAELYSVFVSSEGKIVFSPTGPATNLGDFYDLFEKPEYKEYYKYIKQVTIEKNEPLLLEREEGGLGKISAAPIRLENEIRGFWILGSYTQEETDKLASVMTLQWQMSDFISDYLNRCRVIEIEAAKAKGAGVKLREELARQSIINSALSKMNSKLVNTVEHVVDETIRDVGLHLEAGKVFFYTIGKNRQYELRNYWDVAGESADDSIVLTLPSRMYTIEDEINRGEDFFIVDNANNLTEQTKLNLMRYNFKAVMVYPIYMNDKLHGMMFFAETKTERVWTKEERRFAQSVTLLIQNMLENAEGDGNIRTVNKHLIETYNNFNVGVFVRDAHTGEVLFSNARMNEMLGYDFTGGDCKSILTDLHDRFDNITGMRKPFITKEKVVNWRSYIKTFDDIMDITEIQIEWLEGEEASLIILRKAKE